MRSLVALSLAALASVVYAGQPGGRGVRVNTNVAPPPTPQVAIVAEQVPSQAVIVEKMEIPLKADIPIDVKIPVEVRAHVGAVVEKEVAVVETVPQAAVQVGVQTAPGCVSCTPTQVQVAANAGCNCVQTPTGVYCDCNGVDVSVRAERPRRLGLLARLFCRGK